MLISVDNISKQFGSFKAVDEVSLEVKTGSLVSLLGPSGSGKSTLLRLIAGLEHPNTGKIWIGDEDATRKSVQKRGIGFVFQHYALFKHLTVRQNIAFGLNIRKVLKPRTKARVEELVELVQLKGLGDRYPSQLSGGQRQRVALARALAVEPKVLLLDEPFGALDAKVRKDLRSWLRQLHDEVHVTTVLVTHDQEEAMEVSDEIVVMNKGKVEQIGTPIQIYDKPATSFVMGFIGPVNVLHGSSCLFQGKEFDTVNPQQVFVRPRDVMVETQQIGTTAPAKVSRLVHLGREVQAELTLDDGQVVNAVLRRENFNELELKSQQQVYLKLNHARAFPSHSLS